jgi:hypothetical protein
MPPNYNLYFPWYPTMPPMTVIARSFDGGEELLNHPKYIKNSYPNAHVCVFTVQTSDKSQWCYPRTYKNCILPMDIVGHGFHLG